MQGMNVDYWSDTPCEDDADVDCGPRLKSPFYTLNIEGGGKIICDSEGRSLILEHKHVGFVEELCDIMNENKERLVSAWGKK